MPTAWEYGNAFGAGLLAAIAQPTVSVTTLALDSAYIYNSAGDAFFTAWSPDETGDLTDFWVKVSAYTGTWANTDGVINVEVRENIVATYRPGSTLIGSFTITLDGLTTGWIKKSGLAITLTAGKYYCFVIADADGGAADFVTVVVKNSDDNQLPPGGARWGITTVTTANGFSTTGSGAAGLGSVVIRQAGKLRAGSTFSTLATVTSGTYARGARVKLPMDATLVGCGVMFDAPGVIFGNYSFKVFADGVAPGGTPLMSLAMPNTPLGGTQPDIGSRILPAASQLDVDADTWYRYVWVPGADSTTPRKLTIGGSPDADVLLAALPFGGNAHWIEDASGSWNDSQTASYPFMALLFAPRIGANLPGARTHEVVGVTRDKDGATLASADVYLMKMIGGRPVFVGLGASGGAGAYALGAPDADTEYLVIARKTGAPNVFDVTDFDLGPTVV